MGATTCHEPVRVTAVPITSFIRDSLKKTHNHDPGRDRPHTYEEFLAAISAVS